MSLTDLRVPHLPSPCFDAGPERAGSKLHYREVSCFVAEPW